MRPLSGFALAAAAGLLAGCATSGSPKDPLESYNRAMFAFNETVDKVAFKPLAQGYEAAVPLPARTGIANFFGNLGDAWIALNNLFQGKPREAAVDAGRLVVNSTLGIGGLFDVASEMGLEKHNEDLGQTFGRWGWQDSAYFVLPLLGPRTVRDSIGLIGDSYADPVMLVDHIPVRNSLYGTRFVSNRASLLPAEKVVEEAALDKYAYVRDGYLQRRRSLIHDGNPPREKLDEGTLPGPAYAALEEIYAVNAAGRPDVDAPSGERVFEVSPAAAAR